MKHEKKLSSEERDLELTASEQLQQNQPREFTSPEELLRFDAARTAVPAGISQRLVRSSAAIPPPKSSWWKRLFGR